jgi:hypothetical protein
MAADLIVYCLQEVTDYDQFERLSHDLMALNGYPEIEPLGGFKDKGRDALHLSNNGDGKQTIFAYSVREDWRNKLGEDSEKIAKHGHKCDKLVFLSTAFFTATERDEAHAYIKDTFGWEFDLFGLERLRMLLSTTCKEVVANHPQIFCPPFFPVVGGLSISPRFDHLILDHVDADNTIALWLARRLTLAGYRVWCRNLAPLAGSSANESIRTLIKSRACRYLPILSPASASSPELASRRAFAHAEGESRHVQLVLPIFALPFQRQLLDPETGRLEGAHFEDGWASGLKSLLAVLDAAQTPKDPGGSAPFVLESFMPPDVLVNQPEMVGASLFPVTKVPTFLKRWDCKRSLSQDDIQQARLTWAFRKVAADRFISFCEPPAALADKFGMSFAGRTNWNDVVTMDGIRTRDIGKELLRRSLDVVCAAKGLIYCADREFFYFPPKLVQRELLPVQPVVGKSRRVGVVGERKFGAGANKSRYRYYLAVVFSAIWNTDCYGIVLRPRIHITNLQGQTLTTRGALARRKDIGGTWWNDDWFLRIQGVMQFLATGTEIAIGALAEETVSVAAQPRTWQVATSINDAAVKDAKADRDEIAKREEIEDDDDSDEAATS